MDNFNNRTNKFINIIKSFEYYFKEEFDKCDIKKCGHCGGTGLKYKGCVDSYCEICGGMGYRGFKKLEGHFVCRNCNGGGCNLCNWNGVVDWIEHVTCKDISKKP